MNEKTTKRKSLHLLNNLRNFNEIFRKDMTSDHIKNKKKPQKYSGSALFLEDTLFKNLCWGGLIYPQIPTPPPPQSKD